MNRLLLLFALVTTISTVHAQTGDSTGSKPATAGTGKDSAGTMETPKASPAQRSARQLTALTKKLRLNQDQVIQLRPILLNQAAQLDSLHTHPSGEKRAALLYRRSLIKDTDEKINSLLNDQQKQLYQQWKEEQKERILENQLNRQAAQGQ